MYKKSRPYTISQDDIYYCKLFLCIRDIAPLALSKILEALYREHPFSNNGKAELVEFCCKVEGQKKVNLKKLFGKIFIEKFEHFKFIPYSDESNPDISSIFLIFDEMKKVRNCEKDQTQIKDLENRCKKLNLQSKKENEVSMQEIKTNLEELHRVELFVKKKENIYLHVDEVKKIRNDLCHASVNGFSKKELLEMKQHLLNSLQYLLKQLDDDMDAYKEYSSRIESIFAAPLSEEKIEELRSIKLDDPICNFILRFREELTNVYKDMVVLGPLIFLNDDIINFNIEEVFTEATITVKNCSLSYEQLLTHKLHGTSREPPAVVLSGNAGLGKTTMCRKLTYDWCQNASGSISSKYDLLLHIEVKRSGKTSLVDYLKTFLLPESLKGVNKDDIISHLKQCNLLFLIDGYDERSESAHRLIEEIMMIFPNKKFVITTRPLNAFDIFSSLQVHNLLYLDATIWGFNETKKATFITKVWDYLKKRQLKFGTQEAFMKYLQQIGPLLGDMQLNPLIILILIYIWLESKNSGTPIQSVTFTSLYAKVFELMLERVINHIKQDNEVRVEDLKVKLHDVLKCISKECYRLVLNDSIVIDREMVSAIQNEIKNVGLKEYTNIMFSSFFLYNKVNRIKDKDMADYLEFLHKTQLEYLVAVYIEDQCNSKLKIHDNETMVGITSFLIGLHFMKNKTLQRNFIEELINPIHEKLGDFPNRLNIYWKLLSETQLFANDESQDCIITVDKTFSNLLFEKDILPNRITLTDSDVVSGIKLLTFINKKPEELDIEISGSVSSDISYFFVSFSDMKHYIKKRYDEHSHTKVSLYLREDLSQGSLENEDILICLDPWGALEYFSGYLGDHSHEYFQDCHALRMLDVRFSSVRAMKDCIVALQDKKNCFKKLSLNINVDKSIKPNAFPSIDLPYPITIYVIFNAPVADELSWVVEVLKNLKPKGYCIDTVSLYNTNLDIKTADDKFIKHIEKMVSKKITIKSTEDAQDEIVLKIRSRIKLPFDWIS